MRKKTIKKDLETMFSVYDETFELVKEAAELGERLEKEFLVLKLQRSIDKEDFDQKIAFLALTAPERKKAIQYQEEVTAEDFADNPDFLTYWIMALDRSMSIEELDEVRAEFEEHGNPVGCEYPILRSTMFNVYFSLRNAFVLTERDKYDHQRAGYLVMVEMYPYVW